MLCTLLDTAYGSKLPTYFNQSTNARLGAWGVCPPNNKITHRYQQRSTKKSFIKRNKKIKTPH